jgi:glycosyltransferase involved in cell wall biosynthesis
MFKKKVLYITHGLPPESYGGVEVYTNNLFEEFKKSKKFYPILLTRTNQEKFWPGLIWGDNKDCQKFYTNTPHSDIFNLINQEEVDNFFKEFLINTKPDIIHFEHYLHLSLTWFEIIKKTLPKSIIILTTHEYIGICPNSGQMIKTKYVNNKLCTKSSLKDCSKCFPYLSKDIIKQRTLNIKKYFSYINIFTGPSEFIKNRYVQFGIPKDKFLVSENGQHVFNSIKQKKHNGFKLVYIGQINKFKGLHVLLEAMSMIKYKNITLDIYGKMQDDTEYNQNILNKIDKLDNTNFHGPYSQDQLPKILSNYDILIVSSIWWENSPLVIQEAFMARLPIICSDIGGMAEKVTNNVNGLHFKTGNSHDLIKKICKIYKSPMLLKKLIDKIPKVKSIKENRIELENLYSKLI